MTNWRSLVCRGIAFGIDQEYDFVFGLWGAVGRGSYPLRCITLGASVDGRSSAGGVEEEGQLFGREYQLMRAGRKECRHAGPLDFRSHHM